ncbi:hypothetical protein IHE55_10435 [Streptomyces pactum]|uniref:Uncharacterized protein n=1 Tax=Streptomyces pactum TaxID=68249 RepID=A0ABS0NJ13_9ACTN|nr:hypothetical protein [Streptomyces pactum]MBH5335185.1 hypothetical protein [Streptomyces pactum]
MRVLSVACAAVVAASPVVLVSAAHATGSGGRGAAPVHAAVAPVAGSAAGAGRPVVVSSRPAVPPAPQVPHVVRSVADPAGPVDAARRPVVTAESELARTGVGPVGWIVGVAVAVVVLGVLLVRRMSRD